MSAFRFHEASGSNDGHRRLGVLNSEKRHAEGEYLNGQESNHGEACTATVSECAESEFDLDIRPVSIVSMPPNRSRLFYPSTTCHGADKSHADQHQCKGHGLCDG